MYYKVSTQTRKCYINGRVREIVQNSNGYITQGITDSRQDFIRLLMLVAGWRDVLYVAISCVAVQPGIALARLAWLA